MKPEEDFYCPRCASREIAEIIYGYVSPDDTAEFSERRFILGGCVVEAASPRWRCLGCEHSWGRARLEEGPKE